MADPKRVTALGGIFMKSNDPAATRNWYKEHLGFNGDQYGATFEWRHAAAPDKKGTSVWNTFPADTKYFAPSGREFMINLQVENLEWLLDQLKAEGIDQIGEMQVYEYGKFAHIVDPDGTKIELWEPADEGFDDEAGEGAAQ